MTELNRGEFVVNADGGLTWCGTELGGMHKRLPHEVSSGSIAALIRNGYKRVFHEAAGSLEFPSGSVVLTDGSHITGRIEPEPDGLPWDNIKPGAIVHVRKPVPYTVRCQPAVMPTNHLMTSEELHAALQAVLTDFRKQDTPAEPQRAPLPHFNQRTEFDPFPGFKVRSDTGWMTGEDGHPLQRMTADSPTHGSAHLLAKP